MINSCNAFDPKGLDIYIYGIRSFVRPKLNMHLTEWYDSWKKRTSIVVQLKHNETIIWLSKENRLTTVIWTKFIDFHQVQNKPVRAFGQSPKITTLFRLTLQEKRPYNLHSFKKRHERLIENFCFGFHNSINNLQTCTCLFLAVFYEKNS